MARAQPQKKKKKFGQNFFDTIAFVFEQGPRFSPKKIQELADIASQAEEEKNQMRIAAVPKKKSEIGDLVFKRTDEPAILKITEAARRAAVGLGEELELEAQKPAKKRVG